MKKFILILLLSFNSFALQILEGKNPQITKSNLFVEIQNLAKSGDVSSQFRLAGMYIAGNGVEKNNQLAFYWFKQVAEKGYANAQFNIANSYYSGIGIKKDKQQAAFWYKKAANQGLIPAIYNLATILNEDKATKLESIKWFEKGAKLGHGESQLALANIYHKGDEVKVDDKKADLLFREAVKVGAIDSEYYYAKFLYESKQYKKAGKYYIQAINKGSILANYELANIYLSGKVKSEDDNQIIKLLTKAADNNHSESQQILASIYTSKKQIDKAVAWYKKAATNNNAKAQYSLAIFYLKGLGVEKNINKATELFIKSAKQGHISAQYSLAMRYLRGDGIEVNYYEAVKWLERAAKNNHTNAMYSLSVRYKLGQGVKKDETKRIFWLQKAANNDNKTAKYELNVLTILGKKTNIKFDNALTSLKELSTSDSQFSAGANYHLGKYFLKTNPSLAQKYLSRASNNGYELADKLLHKEKSIPKVVSVVKTQTATIVKKDKPDAVQNNTLITSIKPKKVNNNLADNFKDKNRYQAEYSYRLATSYLNNPRIVDYKIAFELMQKSAKLGFIVAQNDLAMMYLNGIGTDVDLQKAYTFANLALKNGYLPATQTQFMVKLKLSEAQKFKR